MDRTRDRRKPRCDATPGTDLARQSFVILSVVALGYALLAGLRTAADYDLGWQLADSPEWQSEAERYGITTILIPLAR